MATVPSLERSLSQLLSPSQGQRLVGGGQINPMDLTQTRGSSQAPALGTGTPLGNMAGVVPFSGGTPNIAGAIPQGLLSGGLQMPPGLGLLPFGVGAQGGAERGSFFPELQAPTQEPAINQGAVSPRADLRSLVASAQGASRAAQPSSGGIDFEAISRFFQSGGPQSRAILGPGGFNNFVGNISTIFNPVQSAISSGAQSVLALLKGGGGSTAANSGRGYSVPTSSGGRGGSSKGVMPQGFEEIVQDMLSKYISGENVPILPESSLGVPITGPVSVLMGNRR